MLERFLIPLAKAAQESKEIPAKVVEYTKRAEVIDREHKLIESLELNPHEGNFARTYMGYRIYEQGQKRKIAKLNGDIDHARALINAREIGSTINFLIFKPMLRERRIKAGKLITENALYNASVENAQSQLCEERGAERAKQIMSAVDEFLPLYFKRREIIFRREEARIADAKIDDKLYELKNRLTGANQNVH